MSAAEWSAEVVDPARLLPSLKRALSVGEEEDVKPVINKKARLEVSEVGLEVDTAAAELGGLEGAHSGPSQQSQTDHHPQLEPDAPAEPPVHTTAHGVAPAPAPAPPTPAPTAPDIKPFLRSSARKSLTTQRPLSSPTHRPVASASSAPTPAAAPAAPAPAPPGKVAEAWTAEDHFVLSQTLLSVPFYPYVIQQDVWDVLDVIGKEPDHFATVTIANFLEGAQVPLPPDPDPDPPAPAVSHKALKYTPEEKALLLRLYDETTAAGGWPDWNVIAAHFPDRKRGALKQACRVLVDRASSHPDGRTHVGQPPLEEEDSWTKEDNLALAQKLSVHPGFPAAFNRAHSLQVLREIGKRPTQLALAKIRSVCDRAREERLPGQAQAGPSQERTQLIGRAGHGSVWTSSELETLSRLRDESAASLGGKPDWAQVAAGMQGRTAWSCQARYSQWARDSGPKKSAMRTQPRRSSGLQPSAAGWSLLDDRPSQSSPTSVAVGNLASQPRSKSTYVRWTDEQVALLGRLHDEEMQKEGQVDWPRLAKHFPGRTVGACKAIACSPGARRAGRTLTGQPAIAAGPPLTPSPAPAPAPLPATASVPPPGTPATAQQPEWTESDIDLLLDAVGVCDDPARVTADEWVGIGGAMGRTKFECVVQYRKLQRVGRGVGGG